MHVQKQHDSVFSNCSTLTIYSNCSTHYTEWSIYGVADLQISFVSLFSTEFIYEAADLKLTARWFYFGSETRKTQYDKLEEVADTNRHPLGFL